MIDSQTLLELADLKLTPEQMSVVLRIIARCEAIVKESEQALVRNRAMVAARTARYRARGGGNIPEELRQQVYTRDGFVCVYCGAEEDLTCDHVIPVSKSGPTTLENLATACRPCNARKKDKERKEFARNADNPVQKDGQPDSLARTVVNTSNLQEVSITPLSPLPSSRASSNEPPELAELWEIFPPRHGSRDRKGAAKALRAAKKRATIEEIKAGMIAYRAEMQAKGKLNTEYVRQMRTWLNADGWKENYGQHKSANGLSGHKNTPQPSETREEYIRRLAAMSRA